jgi:hypothetical protein
MLWLGCGIVSLWLWLAVYVVFIMAGTLWRWCGGKWREIEVIEREGAPEPVLPIPDEVH